MPRCLATKCFNRSGVEAALDYSLYIIFGRKPKIHDARGDKGRRSRKMAN